VFANLVDVKLHHVGDLDLKWDALLLPLEVSDGGRGTSLVEAEGHEFGVGSIGRRDLDAKSVEFRIVLIAAPALRIPRENPSPGPFFLELEEESVGACLEVFASDFDIV